MDSLTERERQILSWIEENPAVTQSELAGRAGISRSSVAVHVSSLMRKGAILGRRYVVRKAPYVTVVGGANLAIGGRPFEGLGQRDSNPGSVTTSPGGAGRNIAHNLALLGQDVRLVSAFGTDERAALLTGACRSAGIDISSSLTVSGGTTSTYLFVADRRGDMSVAVADMRIFDELTPAFLERHLDALDRADVCVIDANLPVASIRYLSEHVRAPLFCDPVSTAKAEKLGGVLGRLHTLKPNRLEAEVLTGVHISDRASLDRAVDRLLGTGLERVFVSLGSEGVLCADHTHRTLLPPLETRVANTTGAGDAMMAAITWSWLCGHSLEEGGRAGIAAAAICVESPDTISASMSEDALLARMETCTTE